MEDDQQTAEEAHRTLLPNDKTVVEYSSYNSFATPAAAAAPVARASPPQPWTPLLCPPQRPTEPNPLPESTLYEILAPLPEVRSVACKCDYLAPQIIFQCLFGKYIIMPSRSNDPDQIFISALSTEARLNEERIVPSLKEHNYWIPLLWFIYHRKRVMYRIQRCAARARSTSAM